MPNKLLKVAFWFSDTWAGIVCILCIVYGASAPIMLPVYQRMSGLEETSDFLCLGISSVLFIIAYFSHRIRQRSLLGLILVSIAVTAFSVYIKSWVFWACILPIIWLPYLSVIKKLNVNHANV